MAFSMMFSSTITPIKATSTLDSNAYTIMSLDDNNQSEENNESTLVESDSKQETSSTIEEDIEDSSEEKIIYSQQSLTADIYTDSSFGKDSDYQIKIKGTFPEDASIKAYIKANNEKSSDREDILSFAYEIFDKDGNVIEENSSQTFEIEIKSDEISSNDQYFLYENNRYKTINKFNLLDGSITFYSKAKRFILERNKTKDLDSKELKLEDDFDEELTYQDLYAEIYKDKSYDKKGYDPTKIKLNGLLPAGAKVKAYPVEIKIEGQEVLAAYDITVFDKDGKEYKVGPDNNIRVKITNKKIKKAKKVDVYHKENEFAPEERIDNKTKTDDTVAFKADSFSIYAVTDPEGQNIKFVFFYQDKDGKNIVWDVQNIRNGEKLIQPELPIFSHDGKFEGWYYYDYGNKDKAEEDRFGEKFDFESPVKVDENSPDVIYLKGKYPDVLIINFIDEKKYEKDDGTFGYVDEILSTKEVPAGGTIPSDDIPVIPQDSKTVFSHWSLKAGGKEAFDFSTTITKDFIKSHQQGKNYGELNLYAVYKQALTVSFDSQGGSHVNRQIVYSGDTIAFSDLTKPVKPGYEFKYWSESPNGPAFDKDRIISSNTKLYAVYTPQQVKYTINHWMENADDDGYSFNQFETKTANAGTLTNKDSSTYKLSSSIQKREGMVYDHADSQKVIRGDGGTEINLYYKRQRFKYKIFTGLWPIIHYIVNEDVKWGADTTPYYNRAKQILGDGVSFKEDSVLGQMVTYPVRMPKQDYVLRAWNDGKNEWNVRIIDLETNDLIRLDQQTSHLDSESQGYTGGELIPGYTFKYVESSGNKFARPKKVHPNGGTSELPEVWVYYIRNRHTLTFSSNGSGNDITISNVPYDYNLEKYVPDNYIIGQTKNSDGKIFAGWYDNSSGSGNPIDFSKETMPDNDLKVYAKWELPKYKVIAYKQRNNPAAGTSEQIIKEGGFVDKSQLSADKPPIAESTPGSILRWYAFIGGALVEYNFSDPVSSDIYLYPVWLAPVGNELRPLSQIYRVKYRAPASNGTDVIYLDPKEYVNHAEAIIVAPNIDKKYQFPDGSTITMPIDQVFQGWIIDQDSDFTTIKEKEVLNKVYQPGDIINVVGNIMFKPLFNEYKITSVTLKETGPHGENLPDVLIEKRVHNIKLPDDIKDPRDPEDLRVNDTTILPEAKASNTEGYKFLGWSTTEDGKNGKIFNPGQKVLLTNENLPNTLYGIWQANRTIKIYDKKADSTNELIKEVTLDQGESYQLPVLADRDGYKFVGYSINKDAIFPDYRPLDILRAEENKPLPENLYAVYQKSKKITFHNTNIDYNTSSAKADDVTIKVTYQLNGEKLSYDEKELKINHNHSVTIDLPIEASDVEYQVIPNDYFKLVSVTPEKLGGRLGDHYGDGVDNISVEIVVARKRLTYDSNIESIYFDGIRYENGGTIIDESYTKTLDKDGLNYHHTDSFYIKDKRPKGFEFLGWSSTSDGKNKVAYTKNTKLIDIKEEKLYAIWSRPKKFEFVIDNPNGDKNINYTVKLKNYYDAEKTYDSEATLETPTASSVTEIAVNSEGYSYEIIKPKSPKKDGKFDKYTYIIRVNRVVPTGIIDNIGPMALVLVLAILGFALRLYKKYLLRGGFDE